MTAATTAAKTARPVVTVTTYPDGPLIVRGDFAVCGVDGTPVGTGRVVALCRCGRSGAKPLCDGSHRRRSGRLGERRRDE